jgi:hypothetical protein
MICLSLCHLLRTQATQKKMELVAEDLEWPVRPPTLSARLNADAQDLAVHMRDRDISHGIAVHQMLQILECATRRLKSTVKEGEGEKLAPLNVVRLGRAVELIGLCELADVRGRKGH